MGRDPIGDLGLSCPWGGDFYICQNSATKFLGCCTTDPCADGTGLCPADHLRKSSFAAEDYHMIKVMGCVGGNSTGSLWYTCTNQGTGIAPFMGCCKNVPCGVQDACPAGNLTAAMLSSDPYDAAVFMSDGNSSTAYKNSRSGLSTGAIAGIAVGVAVAVIALAVGLFFWWRKRKNTNKPAPTTVYANSDQVEQFRNNMGPYSPNKDHNGQQMAYSPYRADSFQTAVNPGSPPPNVFNTPTSPPPSHLSHYGSPHSQQNAMNIQGWQQGMQYPHHTGSSNGGMSPGMVSSDGGWTANSAYDSRQGRNTMMSELDSEAISSAGGRLSTSGAGDSKPPPLYEMSGETRNPQ